MGYIRDIYTCEPSEPFKISGRVYSFGTFSPFTVDMRSGGSTSKDVPLGTVNGIDMINFQQNSTYTYTFNNGHYIQFVTDDGDHMTENGYNENNQVIFGPSYGWRPNARYTGYYGVCLKLTSQTNGNVYYYFTTAYTRSGWDKYSIDFYFNWMTEMQDFFYGVTPAIIYNWLPVTHLAGNSGQFSMDLSTIDASIIGDGETQTGSNDTTKIKIFEVSNFQNIVANFLDDQETTIAYCGGNYMTATCQRIEESPTAIFRKIRLKLYYQADNTLIYTSPYFNVRIGGLQTYYLSMIKDNDHYMAAFDLIDVPQSGDYRFVYNKWTLPSEVEMSQIYQWLLANEEETEGPYDTGSEDSGGDPSTPRAQDHIGDSPVPTTGGLNIGFVTLYKPSPQDLVNIAGFLWSDNVLANFKKYFNNFADNLIALFSLPYDAPDLDTKAFTVGNIPCTAPCPRARDSPRPR